MTGKECYSFFSQNFLQYLIHSRTPVNVIWMIEYLDGWMYGWMYRRTEYGWVLYLDMLEMCNVCINFLFHWTLSIQRAKGFPTPVWGTSLSTLRLRRLGNEMKSESATLAQGSSSWKWMDQVCTYAKNFTSILKPSMELLQILGERLKMCSNTQ